MGPDVLNGIDNPARSQQMSQFFLVFRTDLFGPAEDLRARVSDFASTIAASPRRPGVDEILLPGQRGARVARARRRDGIPLSSATLVALSDLASDLGVHVPDSVSG